MDILQLDKEHVSQLTDLPERLPESGYLWLDIVHGQDADWPQQVLQLTGIRLHERHSDFLRRGRRSYSHMLKLKI